MTIAAKHFDPQLGIDIHTYLIPPSPIPIPLPTPHIGIVLDPFDYIPVIGGTVQVNGIKRATAGSMGLDIHIPVGGVWMPTMKMPMGPQWDDELFMGSRTVLADGEPFSKVAMPVLACNLVGMVSPIRLKKPKKPNLSLILPTTINIAIPTNVFVGGPPTISMTALLFRAGLAGLGKVLKKTGIAGRAADAFKKLRQKVFKNLPPGMLKCNVLRAEPVDIRDGSVSVTQEDFAIPGRLPLTWRRTYRSTEYNETGACGYGWRTPADIRLEIDTDGSALFVEAESAALFPHLPQGEGREHAVLEFVDGARLSRDGEWLWVRTKDGLRYGFEAGPANIASLQVRTLPIERVEDLCGNFWRFERRDGHLVRIAENGIDGLQGRFIEVEARHNRIERMALHDPATGLSFPLVRFEYDRTGDLIAARDALDAARTFEYVEHRMVRHTDRVGLSFHYGYDKRWRVVRAWGDGGLHDYKFRYDEVVNETEVTDSLGHVSVVKFDANGLPLCEIDPLDGVTVFEYDEMGRTTAVVDPMGLRTEFMYDERGNLLTLVRADRSAVTTTYDQDDRPVSLKDAGGALWNYTWTDEGLPMEQFGPLGGVTRHTYDAHGQLIQFIDANGSVTKLSFDRYGRPCELVDALGRVNRYEHNALGCLISKRNGAGAVLRYHYDAKGRLVEMRSATRSMCSYEYDAEDQLIRHVDEAGMATRLEYTGIGQLSRRLQPDGQSVRFEYDSEEQLESVINQRGERYRMIRDPLGRIVEEVDYWGQSRQYAYDASGRLRRTIDALGRAIDICTDDLGRIVKRTFGEHADPSNRTEELFRYDKAGYLVELKNAASHVLRRFDAEGRLLQEVQNGFVIDNAYDAVGARIERRTSVGNTLKVDHDALGQPVGVTINESNAILMTRNTLGQVVRETLGESLLVVCRYGDDALLSSESVFRDNEPLFHRRYEYDRGGALTRRSDSQFGVETFAYDAMARVVTHLDPQNRLKHWLHDEAGDRLRTQVHQAKRRQVAGGETWAEEWSREGSYDGIAYAFDRSGNLIRRCEEGKSGQPTLHLVWDSNQRLVESCWSGGAREGQRTSYGYDPIGRRVFKRTQKETVWFFWDGDALLAEVAIPNDSGAGDGDVSQPMGPAQGQVVDFFAARRKRDALKTWFLKAREYIYRPYTFEPLALVEGHSASVLPMPSSRPPDLPAVQKKPAPVVPLSAAVAVKTDFPARPVTPTKPPQSQPKSEAGGQLGGLGHGLMLGGVSGLSSKQEAVQEDQHDDQANNPIAPRVGGLGMLGASSSGGRKPAIPLPPLEPVPKHGADEPASAHIDTREPEELTTPLPQGAVAYFHNDLNGAPVRITDAKGHLLWAANYGAWGDLQGEAVSLICNPLRLQGQYEDTETSLYYNRYRYYDPEIGSYVSQDPIKLAGGTEIYQLAVNALQWIDPLGLSCGPAVKRNSAGQWIDARGRFARAPYLPGHTDASILGVPKGSRVAPSNYLPKDYIDNHLAMFDGPVSKITWPPTRPDIGPPGGHFVMPKSVADDVIAKANGDVSKLEQLLGLPPGDLGPNPVRIDIPSPTGRRLPDGNELGANKQWLPGGYTDGGIPEATVDQVPVGSVIINPIVKPTP